MTDQDIIQLGIEAEALLKNDLFNALFKRVEHELANEFLAASLGDDKRIQETHLTYSGMRFFVGKLAQFVSAKDNTIQRIEELNQQAEDDDL